MFVDPDATSMDDIRWIAQRTRRPMDEVKKDKRYNASARNDAAPSHYSNGDKTSSVHACQPTKMIRM
jgi:hypothetical protein